MSKHKVFAITVCVLMMSVGYAIYKCNAIIETTVKGRMYSDVEAVPSNKIGLLLGTGKYLTTGTINPYYRNRIAAATRLYKAGKVRYIIVSGDNGSKDYNEPQMMKEDLILAGVDSNSIVADYAGFRTYDSVIRLKEVFGEQSATIISQAFHNERAIYIARKENIDAIGFNAEDVRGSVSLKIKLRERMARVKVFVDYLIGMKPRFLGPRIRIG